MAMIGGLESQRRQLLTSLERLEALLDARGTPGELAQAVEGFRREMMAHDLTAERFFLSPLCRLHRLDADEADELRSELEGLAADALHLVTEGPDYPAMEHFVGAARRHIDHQALRVVPAARDALARGELPSIPSWYVEEAFGPSGPAAAWPEQWLG